MPPRVVLLHITAAPAPAWARHTSITPVALPPSADVDALRAVLDDAECVMLDAAEGDPFAPARLVRAADPTVQVVVVVAPEARRATERALLFAHGVGELWIASPQEVIGGLAERAAGVTRQRRKFQHTRERLERERITESPQRTERALISDAYLAALVHVLPDAVFSVDENTRVLSANPAATAVLGQPEHKIVGQLLADVLGADDASPLREALMPAVGHTGRIELGFRRAEDHAGWGELITAPVPTDAARVWVVILHDLTEREESRALLAQQAGELEQQVEEAQALTEELAASNAQLQAARDIAERARVDAEIANRSKMDFLAAMSHELRTPLNAIAGYVDLLELGLRGPITEQQRADLQRIKRSERYLLSLVNDVLNFAKLETGAVDIRTSDVPVDVLLRAVDELIAPQARAKALDYDYESCDPALSVHADPEKVQQILLNLIGNAIKFTEPGGRVTLACRADRRTVTFSVTDTGCGIPPDQLTAIFEPFVQIHRSLMHPGEGAGLGLAISRDLAHAMGGNVSAESVVGEGSTFTLTLPRGGEV